jgi:acyl-CoA thioesterase I
MRYTHLQRARRKPILPHTVRVRYRAPLRFAVSSLCLVQFKDPAQLEIMLRARGFDVNVINAGVSGDTTGGMMARLEGAVPKGTNVVILQPGGNDLRRGAPNYAAELRSRLSAMGVKIIMLPNGMFGGKPHQPDGIHLTPEGYHLLAQQLVGPVANMLRK